MEEIYEVAIQIDGQHDTAEMNQEIIILTEEDEFMKKRLGKLPKNRDVTIFRLPDWIHKTNMEFCEPKIVAIGPYHHGKQDLRTMEEHKWYILNDFLTRDNNNVRVETYLQAMRSIEERARNCYSDAVDMKSEDFVRMLLLDGCFMLEYFRKDHSYEPDVLWDVGWADSKILCDMCMLGNQLPFFVIHTLWTIKHQGMGGTSNCKDGCQLLQLLIDFLKGRYSIIQFSPPKISCKDINHFLHLCYTGVVGSKINGQSKLRHLYEIQPIPCATKLHDAGVKIKVNKTERNMLNISFANGTLKMPYVEFHNSRVIILWNMVAFEQSHLEDIQILSSYIALMTSLIETEKDIILLQRSGTLEHFFKSPEEAAAIFKQFESHFILYSLDHSFYDLVTKIRKYTESPWPNLRAQLKQDYFSNPWAIISVVPAGIAFILTIVQTYYSIVK